MKTIDVFSKKEWASDGGASALRILKDVSREVFRVEQTLPAERYERKHGISLCTMLLLAIVLTPLMALAKTWTDPQTGITWTYTSVGGYMATIVSCSPLKSQLIIPSTLDGEPVREVGKEAFWACDGIEYVYIRSGVWTIGEGAFKNCRNMKYVSIPSSVKRIGEQAFAFCSNLENVTIPSGVECIEDWAFDGCSGLTSVTIPSSVTSIGSCAFEYCSGLTSVTILSGVRSIGKYAFAYCSGMTSVMIPPSVTSMGYGAFLGCTGLKTVITDYGDSERVAGLLASAGMDLSDVEVVDGIVTISPDDGTVFESSLTITMSCLIDSAIIRYTVDGSEPTKDSAIYKKFKINDKTTINAVAFLDGEICGDTVTATYAFGRCADPIVLPGDGTVFKHSGQMVTIDKNGEEGVLRYTTDGADPTWESPVYEGPFTVDDSTVVKAKVFSDRYFDSAVVTVNLTREWEPVPTPVITAAEEYTGSETKVVINCAMPEATIRYTTDGSEPNSHSPKYTEPFWVSEGCTVRAVAMRVEYRTSEVASRTITKVWGIGDTMGAPDHAFATSGDAGFVRVEDATAPKGEAMRSGEIGNSAGYCLYSRSVLSTTVYGPCTLKFKWRCSCEEDDGFEWDHAEFAVDGEVKARINGIMDGWAEFTQVITEGGAHAITWTYLKDSSEKDGDDCLWVADYSWTPTELYTHESSVPVPYDWILTYLPHTAYEYDHFEAAVRETAANGVNTVEEAYVAGLDPSDPKDKFVAKIEMVDGKSVVTWTPDLNEGGTKFVRTYKIWGKDLLDADEWLEVTPENHDDMRFFRVTVGMPQDKE